MSDTLDKAKQIILHAAQLRKKREEIDRVTGRNFNLFSILNLSTSENRTHSAFLRELLDPKGSHGQGDVFLRLFIEDVVPVEMRPSFSFDTASASVKCEHDIGTIHSDGCEGGRIDIYLWDKYQNQIAIENKIYAGDQDKQLIRYSNFLKKGNKDKLLLYLTLDNKTASKESAEYAPAEVDKAKHIYLKDKEDYCSISYKEHIRKWLEACRKEVVTIPTVREGITQYIVLVDNLTNNTMDSKTKKELVDWAANADMIAVMKELLDLGDIRPDLCNKLCEFISHDDLKASISRPSKITTISCGGKDHMIQIEFHSSPFIVIGTHWNNELLVGIQYYRDEPIIHDAIEKLMICSTLSSFIPKPGSWFHNHPHHWLWVGSCKEWNNLPWDKVPGVEGARVVIAAVSELVNFLESKKLI